MKLETDPERRVRLVFEWYENIVELNGVLFHMAFAILTVTA